MLTEATSPLARVNVPVFIVGRFWVTAEELLCRKQEKYRETVLLSCPLRGAEQRKHQTHGSTHVRPTLDTPQFIVYKTKRSTIHKNLLC
jgi:hypothetical protein